MRLVYIASPYTLGDVGQNVHDHIKAADAVAAMGFAVMAPLLTHFWHILIPHSYSFWTRLDDELIKRCDYLLRLPGQSAGADAEVALAEAIGIPVFYSLDELREADRG